MADFIYPPEHDNCRCSMVKATILSVQIQVNGEWVDLSDSGCVVGGVLVTDALHNPLFDELRTIVEADDEKANNGSV